MTDKIAAEVCEKEFLRMCEARRIDTDVASMSKPDQKSYEAYRKSLIKMMTRGTLVIGKEGNPEFTPQGATKPVVFFKPTGATLMAQDGFGPNDQIARMTAVATEMTKSSPGALSALDYFDFQVVSEVTNFFLTR